MAPAARIRRLLAAVLLVGIPLAAQLLKAGHWTDLAFVWLACPVIVLAGQTLPAWAHRTAAGAGALSFPLYAVHYPVIALLQAQGAGWAAMVAGSLAAGSAVAIATHWLAARRKAAPVTLEPLFGR